MRALFPHQQQALEWATTRERIALFMEMRLGKSLVAIRWAKELSRKKVLVVGPNAVLPGWKNELEAEGERRVVHLRGSRHDKWSLATQPRTGWFLINYEGLRVAPELYGLPWHAVIVDESTRIRNATAKITKQFLRNFDHVTHRAILTGLPAPESEMDYFCQMAFLNGRFLGFKEFWPFREKLYMQVGYDWVPKKGVRQRIRDEVRNSAFLMTRAEAKIGSRFVMEQRVVPQNAVQRKLSKQIAKDFVAGDLETKYAVVQQTWMRRLAGGFAPGAEKGKLGEQISDAKIKELLYLLNGELKGEQVVVWFGFNQELHAAARALTVAKIPYHTIEGKTPIDVREQRRRRFQSKKVQVVLAQVKAIPMGFDLSAADTAIYYSNVYDYEIRSQTRDRIVHPTKTVPLLLIDLVTSDTSDEDVLSALQEKGVNAKLFVSNLSQRLRERLKELAS